MEYRVFIRSTDDDGTIRCSFYDKNGRRFQKEVCRHSYSYLSVRETDNRYGFMAYARSKPYYIVIDDFEGEHPKRICIDDLVSKQQVRQT